MRIYSLNLATFLIKKGFKYELRQDEDKRGKYYFVFEEDISDAKNDYKNDKELQGFLNTYSVIKREINAMRGL